MTDPDNDLIGLYWTLSGPVEVHVGREWSLFDFADRCRAAQEVGFRGLGLWHTDLEHILQTRTLPEMKAIMEDNGIDLLELEFLMDWFVDPGDPARATSDATRALLFEAAAALGAHHVKVGNIPGTPCETGVLAERFAELCAEAAERHDALIAYEIMPFDVNVSDLDTALKVVEGAGANGGLAIDTWHMSKLGISTAEVAGLPSDRLTWVELSDGRRESMDDLVDETVNHRRLPGEGEFDVQGYVDACRRAGYRGPWGVEVLSAELRELPMDEIFRKAYDTTIAHVRTTPAPA
jgi:sugar phosphate isomerase/epimerase